VFTDERGTFLPGTGYIHTPTTHSDQPERKLMPAELAAMRAAAGLPPRRTDLHES
jgi:hypothetical protein